MAVADLDGDADGLGGLGDGDPVQAVGREPCGEELVVGAHFYLVGVGVNLKDIERVWTADAEALALAYGEAVDAFVVAEDGGGPVG